MPQFSLSNFITFLTTFFLAFFVYFANRRSKINRIFCVYSLSISVWSFCTALHALTASESISFIAAKSMNIGVPLIPIFFFHFCLTILNIHGKFNRTMLFVGYILSSIIIVINFTTNLIISQVRPKLGYDYFMDPGLFYPILVLTFLAYTTAGLYLLMKASFVSTGSRRNQITYLFWGSLLGYGFGISCFLPVYNIVVFPYPFGSYGIIAYVFITTYAIVRHRLMDIRIAVTRAGIFTFVYGLVLGIPFWIGYKYHLWHYATVLMAILATLGPFIYISLEKRSKELLYKTEFKRYETLRRFSKTLLLIKELDKLAKLIVYRLVKTLRVNYAAIYLYDKQQDAYVLKSYCPAKCPEAPTEMVLTRKDALIRMLFNWKKELIREELKNLPLPKKDRYNTNSESIDIEAVQEQMRAIRATLILPHFLENELLGFLVLGDKEKETVYTEEDVSILSSLSNSAALAIENALFLIDLKITQAELFNAKRIAELGYMASAMGHEINNRLQAIYSAALDMIDNPVIYDSIKHNPQIKTAFDKDIAFINENVEDATQIINELKTYARPQDSAKQTFESVNLEGAIEKAVNVVQLQSVKAFEMIELTLDTPPTIPPTYGNFIQLQQVFVNMLNNAHDAIIEMKEYVSHHPELNIANYKGKIDIKIEEVKNKLRIHIIDNGMGMTEDIKKRIFIPLYTSKATAEKKAGRGIKGGTGIGLYTIQIIIKGHEGNIEIHKTEILKGTDFLITLPIARERELAKKG